MKRLPLAALLLCCCLFAQQPGSLPKKLKTLLSKQGFSGQIEGKVNFRRLGTLECGPEKLEVFYYTWEESVHPGQAIHASYRIVLLSGGNHYIGSYVVADRPSSIDRRSLRFDYPEQSGSTIKCDSNGPPKQVLLNGELQILAK